MNDTPALEELIELFLEECRHGKMTDVESFIARYPNEEKSLRELLPLMLEMEGWGNQKLRERGMKPPAGFTSPADFDAFLNDSDAECPAPTDLPNTDYHLLKKIGHGGMGVVYEAIQRSLNRKVAVKLLSPRLVSDARQRKQFEQEARVIAMLHHPNIVKIFSAGSDAGFCYYAMELIDGRGLNQCTFDNPRDVAAVGLQAAEALAYAHRCKVMHRDIKPANLLLDAQRELHVSDFGIACVLSEKNEMKENVGSQSGTPRYMAPERICQGINSFSSDQYSLGVTLYELIAGTPFLCEESPQTLLSCIRQGRIPPLKCSEPDFAAIIHKCIQTRPEDRYASMEDLAEDLRRFLNHEPIHATTVSPMRRLVLWMRRKPAVAALSFASLFCALAFIVALIVGLARTSSALKLAEENASVADATLTNIFQHVETQIPSHSGTRLLATLMPYYQNIAQQRNLPDSQILHANNIIGTYALRAGDYRLAETVFRELSARHDDAFFLNQLSYALRQQGKVTEADLLSRKVVEKFADSKNPAERLEAVRALEILADAADISDFHDSDTRENLSTNPDLIRAFQMIQSLLHTDPKNPEYRFHFASILAVHPRLFRSTRIAGVEPNAIVLLNELAEEFPERPEYGLALVDSMERKLYYSQRIRSRDEEALAVALRMSDHLLGRFPNTPKVVSSVVRFRQRYLFILRKTGQETEARREMERLIGMLEILFHNPEVSQAVLESLLQLQFQRLELAVRDGRLDESERLLQKIERELKQYDGTFQEEFHRRFIELREKHQKK
ncbi:MAG: serine/threonine-protein kinase [Planctomycetia bacterium]|nr:serine/threonine-protein kinase [Planctomycetia bacterium]